VNGEVRAYLWAGAVTWVVTFFLLFGTSTTPEVAVASDPVPAPASVVSAHPALTIYSIVPVMPSNGYHTRLLVTLSNGYQAAINPCRVEDGRRCYWQAGVRGDRLGTSFVVLAGHRFTVTYL